MNALTTRIRSFTILCMKSIGYMWYVCSMSAIALNALCVDAETHPYGTISSVAIITDRSAHEDLKPHISLHEGMRFRAAWTTRDIRRLMSLAEVEDVAIHILPTNGHVALEYHVSAYVPNHNKEDIPSCDAVRRLSRIYIEGVTAFTPRELIRELPITPPRWWRGEGKISCGSEWHIAHAIRTAYRRKGYLDNQPDVRIDTPTDATATLHISVCEGPQYMTQDIHWQQLFFPPDIFEKVQRAISYYTQKPYDPDIIPRIRSDILRISASYSPYEPQIDIVPLMSDNSSPTEPYVRIYISVAHPRTTENNRRELRAPDPISLLGLYGL